MEYDFVITILQSINIHTYNKEHKGAMHTNTTGIAQNAFSIAAVS